MSGGLSLSICRDSAKFPRVGAMGGTACMLYNVDVVGWYVQGTMKYLIEKHSQ